MDEGFLPSEVRGWLLLRNSGLSHTERSAVIASTSGILQFPVIYRALRAQFPPRDLRQRDSRKQGPNPRHGGKGGRWANAHAFEEAEWDEDEMDWEEGYSEYEWGEHQGFDPEEPQDWEAVVNSSRRMERSGKKIPLRTPWTWPRHPCNRPGRRCKRPKWPGDSIPQARVQEVARQRGRG